MTNSDTVWGRIPQSPTLPGAAQASTGAFDVADLFDGPRSAESSAGGALAERLRQAYFWITNSAIISPHYDLEFDKQAPAQVRLGESGHPLALPSDQSYSSFVLLPLLTLMVGGKCLLVGGPGRGKTASALLMGVLAGYSMKQLKRAVQHGQPQMTVSDLLGHPLPSDLLKAEDVAQIRIAWREWLGMGVKIIDEYNRIPTRTQSALLTVMGDNYAELFDQVYECPDAAWYLTANDDAGGGTYQVIEALKDRIDVVVRALAFNSRFLSRLLLRVEEGVKPEAAVPPELIFSPEDWTRLRREIRRIPIPKPVLRRLEHFAAQFEFWERAGAQWEYKTKDNLKVSGRDWNQALQEETGRDPAEDLGLLTQNGLSVRTFLTCLNYLKALAYFRSRSEVGFDEARALLPFILQDKLVPNLEAAWFDQPGHEVYRTDRVGWIRRLWDLSCAEYDRLDRDAADPVGTRLEELDQGLEGLSLADTKARLAALEAALEDLARVKKVSGPQAEDALTLKYLHQRYTNYRLWLEWRDQA